MMSQPAVTVAPFGALDGHPLLVLPVRLHAGRGAERERPAVVVVAEDDLADPPPRRAALAERPVVGDDPAAVPPVLLVPADEPGNAGAERLGGLLRHRVEQRHRVLLPRDAVRPGDPDAAHDVAGLPGVPGAEVRALHPGDDPRPRMRFQRVV